ncbi:Sec-independent protein translocase subunit TatA/TatB [Blattabacterium cuenoti]|uniref:Sec-independent protein translocase subunit TatA/TatB n=1 Tax=Blattabacterium cuenoti TaxID=1653831 RepID=UPI001EEA7C50|nr:twin-arginine translocase TatA/TatE family subunit [Blattabacterium cuenoti]
MNLLFLSIEESFFIIFVAILIFGPKKIPDIARGMGEGIRYLRNAKKKIQNSILQNNINNTNEKSFLSQDDQKENNKFSIKRK